MKNKKNIFKTMISDDQHLDYSYSQSKLNTLHKTTNKQQSKAQSKKHKKDL